MATKKPPQRHFPLGPDDVDMKKAQDAWASFASYDKKGIYYSPNQHAEWNFIEGYLQGLRDRKD